MEVTNNLNYGKQSLAGYLYNPHCKTWMTLSDFVARLIDQNLVAVDYNRMKNGICGADSMIIIHNTLIPTGWIR